MITQNTLQTTKHEINDHTWYKAFKLTPLDGLGNVYISEDNVSDFNWYKSPTGDWCLLCKMHWVNCQLIGKMCDRKYV